MTPLRRPALETLRALVLGAAVTLGVLVLGVALAMVLSQPFHEDADGANMASAAGFLLGAPFAALAGGWAAGRQVRRRSAFHGALAPGIVWLVLDTILILTLPFPRDRVPGVSIIGVAVVVFGALGGGIAGWLGRFSPPAPSTPGGGAHRRRWRRRGRR